MRKRVLPIIALWCLILSTASAQDPKLRKAEEAMQTLQYREAIRLYEEVLAKAEDQQVRICLAVAYRKNQEYERAAAAFAQVSDWTQATPECLLQYGRVLMQMQSCAEAQPVFDAFIERRPYDSRVDQLRDVCASQERIRNKNQGLFEVFPAGFNTAANEMAPSFYGEELVFASVGSSPNGEFLDLFKALDPFQQGQPMPFAPELNTRFHEATATFTADLSRIFFTRSRETASLVSDTRIVPLEIMSSTRKPDGAWAAPEPLQLTDPMHSAAHPCLSPDGNRLYFSSDLPGGYGGKDLYYTDWTGSAWSAPTNLGPEINTEGDEIFPFFGADNRLYFSSDGHLGIGGHDIFYTTAKAYGVWGEVQNLGAPFNSPEDDFAFVLAPGGNSGFFSSNRAGGAGGDDIYGFRRLFGLLELSFEDASSGNPVPGVNAQSDCEGLRNSNTLRLPLESCCTISVEAPGYDANTREICGSQADIDFSRPYKIALQKEKVYTLQGKISDQHTGAPLSGASIRIFSKAAELLTEVVADDSGTFSIRLPKNQCYTFKVNKADYFARTLDEVVCAKGDQTVYALEVQLQPFWISASSSKHPSVGASASKGVFLTGAATGNDQVAPFLLQIYYNQFSTQIREDAMPEMERLLRLLEDNPSVVLEISSHTDSRGDTGFNQRLSQKRAEGVVKWLIERGIDGSRLVAKGYGESRPVNRCSDGVTCPDSEHQFNRRTEFRVLRG